MTEPNRHNNLTPIDFVSASTHTTNHHSNSTLNFMISAKGEGIDRKIEKKFWTKSRMMMGGGAALLALLILGILFGDRSARLNVEAEKITITDVRRAAFQEFIPVTGTVMPLRTVFIDIIQPGRIEKIFVEEGATLNQGDTILALSNSDFLLSVMTREAALFQELNSLRNTRLSMEQTTIGRTADRLQQEQDLEQHEALYKRNVELFRQQLISAQEFEQSKSRYEYLVKRRDLARANFRQDSILRVSQLAQIDESMRRLQSNLMMVKQSLSNLVVRAPMDGQLASLSRAELGQSLNAGARLGQIDKHEGFKVRVPIDEHYISRISAGQTGECTVSGKTYPLVIKKVYTEVVSGRFEVDMEFSGEPPQIIRRGQSLQIRLMLGDLAEATLLARGGFYQKTGGQWAFVVSADGESATKRTLKLGRQNPDYYEVLDGVEVGEKVITSSYDSFGDAEKLILKK
jgi:HlyD family secretion protein